MPNPPCRPRCFFCEQPIQTNQPYWYCNATTICQDCIAPYAIALLAPFRHLQPTEFPP